MELAVNNFNKGLQMDTHPMVLGNDTLTDALNATFITMNGNEIVLQNDMGNRRVNNAFLPSGYEPVGMKEYGGVIYIAAYNPITNKSQIGSFPSPLRKMDGLVLDDLKGLFNIINFTFNKDYIVKKENDGTLSILNSNIEQYNDLNNIWVLKSDSFLIPLTNDTSLRAGDKYSIYSGSFLYEKKSNNEEIFDAKRDITNYYNTPNHIETFGKKALSPKNKRFTLSVGVLNSLNLFVDITKTLKRIKNKDSETYYENYDESVSDVYKFNDGYFIAPSKPNIENIETLNDLLLTLTRQKLALNTYSYKLTGPMYLKFSLNHIVGFDYNIYGILNKDSDSATLWIEGYITYNCPDGYVISRDKETFTNLGRGNLDYVTFAEIPNNYISEGHSLINGFDLLEDGILVTNNSLLYFVKDAVLKKEADEVKYGDFVYDPTNNLYHVKITKKYNNIIANHYEVKDGKISQYLDYNYILGVNIDYSLNNEEIAGSRPNQDWEGQEGNINDQNLGLNDREDIVNSKNYNGHIYLKDLCIRNSIDLSKLGCGEMKLVGWKFSNTIGNVTENNIEVKKLTKTKITYSFIKYPKYNEEFKNLRLIFVNIYDPNDVIYYDKKPSSENDDNIIKSKEEFTINWNDEEKRPELRLVYGVTYTYDIYNKETEKLSTYDENGNNIGNPKERDKKVEDTVALARGLDWESLEDGSNGEGEGEISGTIHNEDINNTGNNSNNDINNNGNNNGNNSNNDESIPYGHENPFDKIPEVIIDDEHPAIPIDEAEEEENSPLFEVVNANFNLWFISTALFNDLYDVSTVTNFCTLSTIPGNENYNEKFADCLKVEHTINLNCDSKIKSWEETDGEITSNNPNISYKLTLKLEITINKIDSSVVIVNELDYPKWITSNNSDVIFDKLFISVNNGDPVDNDNNYIELDKDTIVQKISELLPNIFETSNWNGENLTIGDLFDFSYSVENDKITLNISNSDILKGIGKKVKVKNVFDSLSNVLDNFLPKNDGYCGPIPNGDFHNNHQYFYDFIVDYNSSKLGGYPNDNDYWDSSGKDHTIRYLDGSRYIFRMRDNDIDYDKKIGDKIRPSIVFTYLDIGPTGVYIGKEGDNFNNINDIITNDPFFGIPILISENFSTYFKNYASFYRVFWKCEGGWVMFKEPICSKTDNNITINKYTIINNLLNGKDFIYCVYPEYNNLDYYCPDKYIYNKNYLISVCLKASYSLKNTSANLINIPYTVGNLLFNYDNNKKDNNVENDNIENNDVKNNNIIKLESEISMNSLLNFLNEIDNLSNNNEVSGIYKNEDGKIIKVDSSNNELNPNFVYLKNNNGELVKIENSLSIFTIESFDNINLLILRGGGIKFEEDPEYPYYIYHNDNTHFTVLDFKGMKLVNEIVYK